MNISDNDRLASGSLVLHLVAHSWQSVALRPKKQTLGSPCPCVQTIQRHPGLSNMKSTMSECNARVSPGHNFCCSCRPVTEDEVPAQPLHAAIAHQSWYSALGLSACTHCSFNHAAFLLVTDCLREVYPSEQWKWYFAPSMPGCEPDACLKNGDGRVVAVYEGKVR